MSEHTEYSDIAKLLSELPEIELPASLTAENLFARLDSGDLCLQDAPEPPPNKVISLVKKMRPVMSYAAAFALLVLVYYGAGMNVPAPAASPSSQMYSAAPQVAAAEAAPQNEQAAAPRMAMDAAPEAVASDEVAPATFESNGAGFYSGLVAELRATSGTPKAGEGYQTTKPKSHLIGELTSGELAFSYRAVQDAQGSISVMNKKNNEQISSFATRGNSVLGGFTSGDRLYLLETISYSDSLYSGAALEAVESEEWAGELPVCGAVLISVYSFADPANVMLERSVLQEGEYAFHEEIAGGDGQEPMLLVATSKNIELPVTGGALLCNIAPMVGAGNDTVLTRAVDPSLVKSYPEGGREQFMLLSLLGDSGREPTQTMAVLGSNLLIQPAGKRNFVIFGNADSEAKAIDSIELGDVTIELR